MHLIRYGTFSNYAIEDAIEDMKEYICKWVHCTARQTIVESVSLGEQLFFDRSLCVLM